MGSGSSLCLQKNNVLSAQGLESLREGIRRVSKRGDVRQDSSGSSIEIVWDVIDPSCHLPITSKMWVPAVFDVSAEGKTTILSQINGLCMVTDSDVYAALALLFDAAVPLLEGHRNSVLRGRTIQVIVKCQTYRLRPGDVYVSNLHKEGKDEGIDAVVLFYSHVDSGLKGGDLQLIKQHDFHHKDMASQQVLEKSLTHFPARENGMLVFDNNDVYHKISDLTQRRPGSAILERTVVGFFVKVTSPPIPDSFDAVKLNEHLWWPLVVRAWGSEVGRVFPPEVESIVGTYLLSSMRDIREQRERFKSAIRVEPPHFVARIGGKSVHDEMVEWRRGHPCNLD